jgi:NAD/NADP octopine/nopaline dehydrogenase, alpha-helical domain
VLAVCGGGNGGHALAVVASQNFDGDVDWLVGSEDKAEELRLGQSAGGLQSTGVITAYADRVRTISADPAQVIPDADIVMVVVPAFAHTPVLRQISPYLKETALIGCLPTRGGFEFDALRLISGIEPRGRRRIFGLQTLPWSTRVVSPGKVVNFGALKAKVLMATLPARHAPAVSSQLTRILGTEVIATDCFLSMTLGNPGQFIHPGLMYGWFRSWNGDEYDDESIPLFYANASDQVGKLVEQLSSEATAVAREIETQSGNALDLKGVLPVHEWLRISYPTQTSDTASVATCFRTGPLQARKAPMRELGEGRFVPNFQYRYLSEDVPFGLVVTRAVAQLANVETPAIDDVIQWAQQSMGKAYLVDGKVEGSDAQHLPLPQNHNVHTLMDLIGWYVDDAHGVGDHRDR